MTVQAGASSDVSAGELRMIVAGSGGQGVMTFCKLLCSAAAADGRCVTYLPSYGPEVRSGTARCRVVISQEPILSPLVEQPGLLVVLNQQSYDRFAPEACRDTLVLVNASGVDTATVQPTPARMVCLPAADLAAEMGDVRVGNVIMLGALVELTALVSKAACREALASVIGKRKAALLDLNVRALEAGAEFVQEHAGPTRPGHS